MILPILETPTHPSNYGLKRESPPELIILHGSGLPQGATGAGELKYLQRPNIGVSYSYYVAKDGSVAQLVPDEYVAWHAGASRWCEQVAQWRGFPFPAEDAGRWWQGLNAHSIGVGLESHNLHGEVYGETQLAAAAALVAALCEEFEIPPYRILTHAMISAPRKQDPVDFPMATFLERIPA